MTWSFIWPFIWSLIWLYMTLYVALHMTLYMTLYITTILSLTVYRKIVEEAPFPNRLSQEELNPEVMHHMTHQLDFRSADAARFITSNIPNSATATYFLLTQRLYRHEAEATLQARIARAVKTAKSQGAARGSLVSPSANLAWVLVMGVKTGCSGRIGKARSLRVRDREFGTRSSQINDL